MTLICFSQCQPKFPELLRVACVHTHTHTQVCDLHKLTREKVSSVSVVKRPGMVPQPSPSASVLVQARESARCPGSLPRLPAPAAATGAQAARAGLSSFRPRALQLPSLVGCFLLAEEEHLGIGKSFLGNNYSQAKEPKKSQRCSPANHLNE